MTNIHWSILETFDTLCLRFLDVTRWSLRPLLNYKYFSLSPLILEINKIWMLFHLPVYHCGNSKLKILWSTELMSCCDIFLNEALFVSFMTARTWRTCPMPVVFKLFSTEPHGSTKDFQGFRKHTSFMMKLVNLILILLDCIFYFFTILEHTDAGFIFSVNHQ